MDKRTYLNILFDYYENLLTDKEKECFLDYYESDFSLGEIASNNNVSRSAVHKTLKSVIDKLENYEDILKMYHKKEEVINLLNNNIDSKLLEEVKNILS